MWNTTTADSLAFSFMEEQEAQAEPEATNLLEQVAVGGFLLLIILACIIGNFLVILSIVMERELRSRPQSYLIFSLAVADLIVGLIVTPLGAWGTVMGAWRLGVTMCDLWITVDVLVCTASILHLVAIALDRYWSITDICYVQNRTPRRILIMLGVIWVVSLLISLAPFAGWKDKEFKNRVEKQHVCLISQQISYQVFSTATAFYIPLCAIICVYYKIMRAAKKRFKRERDRRTVVHRTAASDVPKKVPLLGKKVQTGKKTSNAPPPPAVMVTAEEVPVNGIRNMANQSNSSSASEEDHRGLAIVNGNDNGTGDGNEPAEALAEEDTPVDSVVHAEFAAGGRTSSLKSGMVLLAKRKKRPKETPETKRERKAWRTLAIITGTFVASWTPFFLVSLYRPICRCSIPPALESVTAWLGYLNSALNPIIYTVFSQDFRAAFKKILKKLCFMSDY